MSKINRKETEKRILASVMASTDDAPELCDLDDGDLILVYGSMLASGIANYNDDFVEEVHNEIRKRAAVKLRDMLEREGLLVMEE